MIHWLAWTLTKSQMCNLTVHHYYLWLGSVGVKPFQNLFQNLNPFHQVWKKSLKKIWWNLVIKPNRWHQTFFPSAVSLYSPVHWRPACPPYVGSAMCSATALSWEPWCFLLLCFLPAVLLEDRNVLHASSFWNHLETPDKVVHLGCLYVVVF